MHVDTRRKGTGAGRALVGSGSKLHGKLTLRPVDIKALRRSC